jgi:cyclic beta-1,2-glucan synthetase
MYRLITESLLGLRLEVDRLHFEPCLPAGWAGFKVHYRYRETVYHIAILQGPGEAAMTIDGAPRPFGAIPLVDDRREHIVELRLARS